jgi:four helix bundle protein
MKEIETKQKLESFEDLSVRHKSHQLVLTIYRMTNEFPREEKFGLVAQMRRAAVSIPANIAEGFKKRGLRDKINFYNIAQGSLEEVRYYLILAHDLGFVKDTVVLRTDALETGRMLHGLIRSIEVSKSRNSNKERE